MLDKEIRGKYRAIIGLEVHAQLLTESKIYATDSTEYGTMPNTNISVLTLGHPGTMPRLNRKVVAYAIKMGLACQCTITRYNIFDRKNYFYPDLPKGYQITQDKTPICRGGVIPIKLADGSFKEIGLTRIHIEEDAGKSIHTADDTDTLVDFNRAGVPLIEIVSEPEITSAEEAYSYLTEVRKLVRYLEICDGNMEEGSLRCDANISVMPITDTEFGKKVEVKNMNSIRNVARAIEYEIERQILAVEAGEDIVSETRNFDAVNGTTTGMRTKEAMNDYRYFPEPDLSPLIVSKEWVEEVAQTMPPLPYALQAKFTGTYGLPAYDAQVLTDSKEIALFFEEMCALTDHYKAASNWVMGPVKSYLNERTLHIGNFPLTPAQLVAIMDLVNAGKVSFSSASQNLFPYLTEHPDELPEAAAEKLNLMQDSSEDAIQPVIDGVLADFPDKVAAYKGGNKNLVGLFMGEVMKRTKGQIDPKKANQLVRAALEN